MKRKFRIFLHYKKLIQASISALRRLPFPFKKKKSYQCRVHIKCVVNMKSE
jgi:hypothetical protein